MVWVSALPTWIDGVCCLLLIFLFVLLLSCRLCMLYYTRDAASQLDEHKGICYAPNVSDIDPVAET